MDPIEEKLVALATELGVTETEEMNELRLQIILSDKNSDLVSYRKLLGRYADLGEAIVEAVPDMGSEEMGILNKEINRTLESSEIELRNSLIERYEELEKLGFWPSGVFFLDTPKQKNNYYISCQIAMNILRLRLAYACSGMDDRTEGWYFDIRDQVLGQDMSEIWERIEKIFF